MRIAPRCLERRVPAGCEHKGSDQAAARRRSVAGDEKRAGQINDSWGVGRSTSIRSATYGCGQVIRISAGIWR